MSWSRLAAATLYSRGSGRFVASATAPIASGWGEPVPGRDSQPSVDQRLNTAHQHALARGRCSQKCTNCSYSNPNKIVAIVMGTPVFMYSKKLMCVTVRAFSTTMMLATEPGMVRLPASVLDMASINHMVCGS